MTIAMDIINGKMPDFSAYIQAGESLDDIDEFGFTALIETIIAGQPEITRALLQQKIDVNKPDMAGRSALLWAVDNQDLKLVELLLKHRADANYYTNQGFSPLVYPLLRQDKQIKQALFQYGASLNFAQDFISAKLIGHRFSLKGTVDIVNWQNEMIEVDYEGFVLEFTTSVIQNSLAKFLNNYAARRWRDDFQILDRILKAFQLAEKILLWQRQLTPKQRFHTELTQVAGNEFLILPAASRGHAIGFVRYKDWLVKIDRGENSLKEGSVNIYLMGRPDKMDAYFLDDFLFKKQPRSFFHEKIGRILQLQKILSLPLGSQVVGNCSWANMEACVGIGHFILSVYPEIHFEPRDSGMFYQSWLNWDKDRAIEDMIDAFKTANSYRKASIASILAAVLFQNLSSQLMRDTYRAEKILKTIIHPDYLYILQSYLDVYCPITQKTLHGENLLRLLDNCGYDAEHLGLKFS
jgi:hypothetical protein